VCNCLIEVLLTVVLSTEERVFVVECFFPEGNRYSDLVQQQFADKFPETAVPYLCGAAKCAVCRDRPRTVNELETAITAYIRNISQADLQKVFVSKIKWVQACIDARGHHFQHLS
jgi:hypothetical protein